MDKKIEKIIIDINKVMPVLCDKKTKESINDTYRKILKKHLKNIQIKENICLRCGVEHKEVKKEGSVGCHSRGHSYPKHLWK